MKRDILFLCQFFYPEYNSSATLPFDTASYLAQNGYSVGALCGYPREYNTSGEVPVRETKDGVSIHRLHYMQLSRHSRLGRLINYFSFTLSVLLHIFEIKDYQAVIVYGQEGIPASHRSMPRQIQRVGRGFCLFAASRLKRCCLLSDYPRHKRLPDKHRRTQR